MCDGDNGLGVGTLPGLLTLNGRTTAEAAPCEHQKHLSLTLFHSLKQDSVRGLPWPTNRVIEHTDLQLARKPRVAAHTPPRIQDNRTYNLQ